MNNIQEALNFYGLKSPIKDLEIIKKRFQKLSMKFHPDKGGNENDFKMLSKYREILEKNFDFISQKDSKTKDFGDSKKNNGFGSYRKNVFILNGKEQAEKSINILLEIFVEGLCFKGILFFLFVLYLIPNVVNGLGVLLLAPMVIFFYSLWKENTGMKSLKSASIFVGIGIYILASRYIEDYSKGMLGNSGTIMFYSLLVIPIAIYILEKHGESIKIIITKILYILFLILAIGSALFAMFWNLIEHYINK